jgi:hypothetical protein
MQLGRQDEGSESGGHSPRRISDSKGYYLILGLGIFLGRKQSHPN